MTHFYIILFVLTMSIISITAIIGYSTFLRKPVDKVGHQLEKIKEVNYKYSLKKIDALLAAQKMAGHMKAIEKLNKKISDNEPIKEFLNSFIEKWNTEDNILASLTDGDHLFMTEVNVFFSRGYVKYKDGWKTLFPIFKP
ncbi:MAG: hypothetical protein IPM42_14455 [Saprospiraceae bacterium]|nr:hypothetical protein [Saprospiraceae bacterium]